jgi:hypothetical protein
MTVVEVAEDHNEITNLMGKEALQLEGETN